jgi:DNA-binding beta-propeller fold protein YncE/mono/diheme cytochrome c family protein
MVLAAAIAACNSLDERPEQLEPGPHLVIPTDTRPAIQALRSPPPMIGGTLALDEEGTVAVVADPERDRISIVNLATRQVIEVKLEEGTEPGRVIVDDEGRAHIALRRSGELLTLSAHDGSVIARRSVCSAPRGIAYRADSDRLEVACTNGELITVRADGGEGIQSVQLPEDLRDVVFAGGTHLVSRFKSAELLSLGANNEVVATVTPPNLAVTMDRLETMRHADGSTEQFPVSDVHSMQPHVAWRTAASDDGSIWMLHQVASQNEIPIEDENEPQADSSPYGGGGGCSGIVQTALTRVASGQALQTKPVAGLVLAMDVAVSPDGKRVAIVQAGEVDEQAPRPTVQFVNDDGSVAPGFPGSAPSAASVGAVALLSTESMEFNDCMFPESLGLPGQATSVAYTPGGQLVVQMREPARLMIMVDPGSVTGTTQLAGGEIPLGGETMLDTGHDLFHRNTGAGITCAGCHAEGGDDGHVWRFTTIGARRTQSIYVGLAGTMPFHWDGDMKDLSVLMKKVFVGRMGGVLQSKDRLEVLENWMFSMRPPPPMVASDDEAALRGKALFESSEVGCATCHNGEALTNNQSYDVGTEHGTKLQVPSLRAVGYRAPFIHSGCATTLAQRFDPACGGGDLHGQTSQLDAAQIDDLVAYLRSL